MSRTPTHVVVSLALLLTGAATIALLEARGAALASPDPYNVVVETSEAGGGATWTYTITKAASNTTDLGPTRSKRRTGRTTEAPSSH